MFDMTPAPNQAAQKSTPPQNAGGRKGARKLANLPCVRVAKRVRRAMRVPSATPTGHWGL